VQLYRYIVSQFSEFCRNSLCCFSTSVYCCCCVFRHRLSLETFGYTLVLINVITSGSTLLEKLNSHSLSGNFPRFMEPGSWLYGSQDPATGPYSVQDEYRFTTSHLYWISVLILAFHSCLRLCTSSFEGFKTVLHAFLICPMSSTRPIQLILPEVITLIIFGEEY
jgi:hypothetical protein